MRLLPDTARIESDGSLSIGGCRVDELAERHGTPLFVYDEAHVRARCREAVAAFGPTWLRLKVKKSSEPWAVPAERLPARASSASRRIDRNPPPESITPTNRHRAGACA